tara:strand:+ start:1307 stop:1558 length:252 start_codon:yes stop_codon:yes gene_type:complete
MTTTKKIPTSLQKRIDNVKNRYGVTISEADAIMSYRSDEGGSSVGYWFDAPSHRASLTIGDLAIDLGQWLLGRTNAQPRRFKD